MKLYTHVAACSLAPHIVARELGLDVTVVEVDRKTHVTADGDDYLKINGNGYVPALRLENGEVLIEGPAIVQYLADLRPELGLLPPVGSMARSKVQSWLNFIAAELHKPLATLFDPTYDPVRAVTTARIGRRLSWVAEQMRGDYLMGETFTVADPYLFVCLNWSQWNGFDLAAWPILAQFMGRVRSRPKVQLALAEEGLFPTEGSPFVALRQALAS